MQNGERKKDNWISLVACIAAAFSAFAAFLSANQSTVANKINLRPYLIIKNYSNFLLYQGLPFVVFPYQLQNVGTAPALNICKGYISYIVEKSNQEIIIQDFREPQEKKDALLPYQLSAIHPDNINITGFDPSKLDSIKCIKVELKITYQGFLDIDKRTYFSKSILEFYPKVIQGGKIIFIVSQPKLDFGFEKEEGFMKNILCLNFLGWWPYIVGYLYSIFAGQFFILKILKPDYLVHSLHFDLNQKEQSEYCQYPKFVGYIERILYTTSLVCNQYAWIGIWLALKVASRWEAAKLEKEMLNGKSDGSSDPKEKIINNYADYNTFLIGNGLSVIYAVIGWRIIEWLKDGLVIQSILVIFSAALLPCLIRIKRLKLEK